MCITFRFYLNRPHELYKCRQTNQPSGLKVLQVKLLKGFVQSLFPLDTHPLTFLSGFQKCSFHICLHFHQGNSQCYSEAALLQPIVRIRTLFWPFMSTVLPGTMLVSCPCFPSRRARNHRSIGCCTAYDENLKFTAGGQQEKSVQTMSFILRERLWCLKNLVAQPQEALNW